MIQLLQWLIVLLLAALTGKLISKIKLPSITLLPMAVLDDIVAIIVFFTVNSVVASSVSEGSVSLYMIPVMVLLPVIIGLVTVFLPDGF